MSRRESLSQSIWLVVAVWVLDAGVSLLQTMTSEISLLWALGGGVLAVIFCSGMFAPYIVSNQLKDKGLGLPHR